MFHFIIIIHNLTLQISLRTTCRAYNFSLSLMRVFTLIYFFVTHRITRSLHSITISNEQYRVVLCAIVCALCLCSNFIMNYLSNAVRNMLSMNDDATNHILETAAHNSKEIFQRVDPSKYFRIAVSVPALQKTKKYYNNLYLEALDSIKFSICYC